MFKKFNDDDIVTTTARIEESVVLAGALYGGYRMFETHFVSSSINTAYFLSITDGNPNLPWSNKLATISYGMHTSSTLYTYASASAIDHKSKIYRLYAKTLLGDEDLKFVVNKQEQNELIFISLARNQLKDGIKPGTVSIGFNKSGNEQFPSGLLPSVEYNSDLVTKNIYNFKGGRAADLFTVSQKFYLFSGSNPAMSSSVGLIFYDHGTAALIPHKILLTGSGMQMSGTTTYPDTLFSGNNNLLYGISNKFADFSYTNFSAPRLTFFKCTAEKEEFNYSSNDSYRNDSGEIIVTSGSINQKLIPATYITQIALCNELGQVLAIAKPTQPIKKDFSKKLEITVRLIT